jgi:hypothetical protein
MNMVYLCVTGRFKILHSEKEGWVVHTFPSWGNVHRPQGWQAIMTINILVIWVITWKSWNTEYKWISTLMKHYVIMMIMMFPWCAQRNQGHKRKTKISQAAPRILLEWTDLCTWPGISKRWPRSTRNHCHARVNGSAAGHVHLVSHVLGLWATGKVTWSISFIQWWLMYRYV